MGLIINAGQAKVGSRRADCERRRFHLIIPDDGGAKRETGYYNQEDGPAEHIPPLLGLTMPASPVKGPRNYLILSDLRHR
jgi:hypothetical protein